MKKSSAIFFIGDCAIDHWLMLEDKTLGNTTKNLNSNEK
jgi:hypothetical protein